MDENEKEDAVTVFRVPECNLEELKARIEKLARKATKLRLVPPRLVEEGVEDVPLVRRDNLCDSIDFGYDRGTAEEKQNPGATDVVVGYRRYYKIRLEGEAPVIPGWKLVAVIEHGGTEVGNVLRVVPNTTCPPAYRQTLPICDHCGTLRRRLETFVLLDAEGVYKQVGRNCLADFCRDPEAASRLCGYAEIIESARGLCAGSEDEDFYGLGGRSVPRVGTETLLAMTSRIIRHLGWCSRGAAKKAADVGDHKTATANIVEDVFFNPNFFKEGHRDSQETRELRAAARDVQEKDKEAALAALAWVRGMRGEAEHLSDYLHNLLVVLTEETVHKKHLGIACSAVASHQRHLGQLEERKVEEARRAASVHFGETGKRGRFAATFVSARSFDSGEFGPRYLYRFLVDNQNIAVWWTGKEPELDAGEAVVLIASVKSHDDYKGTAQTTLTRCDVYRAADQARCTNCQGVVLRFDIGKNCPNCKKRGLKVKLDWFGNTEKDLQSDCMDATNSINPVTTEEVPVTPCP